MVLRQGAEPARDAGAEPARDAGAEPARDAAPAAAEMSSATNTAGAPTCGSLSGTSPPTASPKPAAAPGSARGGATQRYQAQNTSSRRASSTLTTVSPGRGRAPNASASKAADRHHRHTECPGRGLCGGETGPQPRVEARPAVHRHDVHVAERHPCLLRTRNASAGPAPRRGAAATPGGPRR